MSDHYERRWTRLRQQAIERGLRMDLFFTPSDTEVGDKFVVAELTDAVTLADALAAAERELGRARSLFVEDDEAE